jgi:hypothetical protein
MKSAVFKHEYAANASKLHKKVGDLLRDSIFKGYQIFQEYPVNKINPNYRSGREKFDWYIKELNIIIEVHGEQHYKPVCFGGISEHDAELNFKRQQFRDTIKKDAAVVAGATYIVIKYNEEVNEETLSKKILGSKLNDEAKTELEDSIVFEAPETAEVTQAKLELEKQKEKRRERLELKELASAHRKHLRKLYKESDRYKEQQQRASDYRKSRYLAAKERQRAVPISRSRKSP